MIEDRRDSSRGPTFLAGTIMIRERNLTISCIVRDLTENGARLKCDTTAVPEHFELSINGRPGRYQARCAWRRGDLMGVALSPLVQTDTTQIERRFRAAQKEQRALRRRISDLTSGY